MSQSKVEAGRYDPFSGTGTFSPGQNFYTLSAFHSDLHRSSFGASNIGVLTCFAPILGKPMENTKIPQGIIFTQTRRLQSIGLKV